MIPGTPFDIAFVNNMNILDRFYFYRWWKRQNKSFWYRLITYIPNKYYEKIYLDLYYIINNFH